MTFHTNYYANITHPVTELPVEARLTFDYTKPHRGGYDEPPEHGGVEIIEVVVFSENIIKEFSKWQIEALEDELFAVECEGASYEPDSYNEKF